MLLLAGSKGVGFKYLGADNFPKQPGWKIQMRREMIYLMNIFIQFFKWEGKRKKGNIFVKPWQKICTFPFVKKKEGGKRRKFLFLGLV